MYVYNKLRLTACESFQLENINGNSKTEINYLDIRMFHSSRARNGEQRRPRTRKLCTSRKDTYHL